MNYDMRQVEKRIQDLVKEYRSIDIAQMRVPEALSHVADTLSYLGTLSKAGSELALSLGRGEDTEDAASRYIKEVGRAVNVLGASETGVPPLRGATCRFEVG